MRLLKLLGISLLAAAIISGGIFALGGGKTIYDWWRLHDYTPPADIAQLASDTTMTPYAKRMFYLNHPSLEKSDAFNQHCPSGGEKTIVLGCYHSNQAGIFLFQVNDPELHGVEQVTAAHETLHAIYDRLGNSEKGYVDGLLEHYYATGLHDPTIKAEIAAYKVSEPNDVVNEMHSVFGTEVADLPGPLEQYYKKYFTDRQKIAEYAASYRSAFTKRESQIRQYDAQLQNMKTTITNDESTLRGELNEIHIKQTALDAERSSGDNAAYNSGVSDYNVLVGTYNSLVGQVKSLITNYNAVVVKRNAIALQENRLSDELDASATPISN